MTKFYLFKHIVFAIVALVLVILGTFYVLFPIMTNHGESMTVPNLEGILLEDLDEFLEERDLRYEVELDSGYASKYPPLTVLKQFPLPNAKVKENRKIYVTLNATNPPVVKMPMLKGRSLKNAQLELRSLGLFLGDIKYKPDFALNTVLGQYYQGSRVAEGTSVVKGSKIDFEVGDGLGNQSFQMLDLKELELEEAVFVLRGNGLTLGDVFYKETGSITVEDENKDGETIYVEKDIASGKIFKQIPGARNKAKIGQTVDLWIVEVDSAAFEVKDIPTLSITE